MSAAADFDTKLRCPRCGQEGRATWAHNKPQKYAARTATSPIATSDGFYLRVAKVPAANPHIVCGRCETVQRD